jgi:hypothetical protein
LTTIHTPGPTRLCGQSLDLGPAGDHDLLDVAPHEQLPVGIADRDGVIVAVEANQLQRACPCGPLLAGAVDRCRQRQESRLLGLSDVTGA